MKFNQIILPCVLSSSVLFSEAHAAEWVTEPTLTLSSTYDDNVTFRATDELDTVSSSLSARLNSQIKEQVWGIGFDGRVRAKQYSDNVGSDTNNVFFNFASHYRTELHSWNFDADFERNTTFDEEFDTQLSANGLLDTQTEREKASISPGWTWTMSQVWSIKVLLQAADIKYDEVSTLDVADSKSDSAQFAAIYQMNDVSDISVFVNYSKTERDQDKRESGFYEYENTSYQLSYQYKASENSAFNIGLGRRETETIGIDVPECNVPAIPISECSGVILVGFFPLPLSVGFSNTNTDDVGNTYSISYDYNHEVSSYSVALNQSVITSSNGFAQEFDDFTLTYNREISEVFSAGLIVNASRSTSVDLVSTSEDRDIIRIEPSVSWYFSKDSKLTAGYRYRQQTYSFSNEETESNSIYVNLVFYWPRLMTSY